MPKFADIIVIKRDGTDGHRFPMTQQQVTFGSGLEEDIRVKLADVPGKVCRIESQNGKVYLHQTESSGSGGGGGGVALNGKGIKPANPIKLSNSDTITIGAGGVNARQFRIELPTGGSKTPRKTITTDENTFGAGAAGNQMKPSKLKTPKSVKKLAANSAKGSDGNEKNNSNATAAKGAAARLMTGIPRPSAIPVFGNKRLAKSTSGTEISAANDQERLESGGRPQPPLFSATALLPRLSTLSPIQMAAPEELSSFRSSSGRGSGGSGRKKVTTTPKLTTSTKKQTPSAAFNSVNNNKSSVSFLDKSPIIMNEETTTNLTTLSDLSMPPDSSLFVTSFSTMSRSGDVTVNSVDAGHTPRGTTRQPRTPKSASGLKIKSPAGTPLPHLVDHEDDNRLDQIINLELQHRRESMSPPKRRPSLPLSPSQNRYSITPEVQASKTKLNLQQKTKTPKSAAKQKAKSVASPRKSVVSPMKKTPKSATPKKLSLSPTKKAVGTPSRRSSRSTDEFTLELSDDDEIVAQEQTLEAIEQASEKLIEVSMMPSQAVNGPDVTLSSLSFLQPIIKSSPKGVAGNRQQVAVAEQTLIQWNTPTDDNKKAARRRSKTPKSSESKTPKAMKTPKTPESTPTSFTATAPSSTKKSKTPMMKKVSPLRTPLQRTSPSKTPKSLKKASKEGRKSGEVKTPKKSPKTPKSAKNTPQSAENQNRAATEAVQALSLEMNESSMADRNTPKSGRKRRRTKNKSFGLAELFDTPPSEIKSLPSSATKSATKPTPTSSSKKSKSPKSSSVKKSTPNPKLTPLLMPTSSSSSKKQLSAQKKNSAKKFLSYSPGDQTMVIDMTTASTASPGGFKFTESFFAATPGRKQSPTKKSPQKNNAPAVVENDSWILGTGGEETPPASATKSRNSRRNSSPVKAQTPLATAVTPEKFSPSPKKAVTPKRSPSPKKAVTPKRSPSPKKAVTPQRSPSPKKAVTPKRSPSPKKAVTPKTSPQKTPKTAKKSALKAKTSPYSPALSVQDALVDMLDQIEDNISPRKRMRLSTSKAPTKSESSPVGNQKSPKERKGSVRKSMPNLADSALKSSNKKASIESAAPTLSPQTAAKPKQLAALLQQHGGSAQKRRVVFSPKVTVTPIRKIGKFNFTEYFDGPKIAEPNNSDDADSDQFEMTHEIMSPLPTDLIFGGGDSSSDGSEAFFSPDGKSDSGRGSSNASSNSKNASPKKSNRSRSSSETEEADAVSPNKRASRNPSPKKTANTPNRNASLSESSPIVPANDHLIPITPMPVSRKSSTSPLKRSPSPKKSVTPKRSPSPKKSLNPKRNPSPKKATTTPRRSPSPKETDTSKLSASPKKAMTAKRSLSPKKAATPKQVPSPKETETFERSPSQQKVATPKRSQSPKKAITPKRSPSPKKAATPKRSASPKKLMTPTRSSSPKKAATPKQVPSPKETDTFERSPSQQKVVTPKRSPSPKKAMTPKRSPSPKKAATPKRSPSPIKAMSPKEDVLPEKVATPGRSPLPKKAATPKRSPSPKKANTPRKSVGSNSSPVSSAKNPRKRSLSSTSGTPSRNSSTVGTPSKKVSPKKTISSVNQKSAKSPTVVKKTLPSPSKGRSPQLVGVKEMFHEIDETSSPRLGGVKELMQSPTKELMTMAKGSDDFTGLKEMVKTPRQRRSASLTGIQSLYPSPQKAVVAKTVGKVTFETPEEERGRRNSLLNKSAKVLLTPMLTPSPPKRRVTRKSLAVSKITLKSPGKSSRSPPAKNRQTKNKSPVVQKRRRSSVASADGGLSPAPMGDRTVEFALTTVQSIPNEESPPVKPRATRGRGAAASAAAKTPSQKKQPVTKTPAKRGRKSVAAVESTSQLEEPPKRRGRKAAEQKEEVQEQQQETAEEVVVPKKRSRNNSAQPAAKTTSPAKTPAKRTRGKAKTVELEVPKPASPEATKKPAKRTRKESSKEPSASPVKRGRAAAAAAAAKKVAINVPETVTEATPATPEKPKARGGGRRAASTVKKADTKPKTSKNTPKTAPKRAAASTAKKAATRKLTESVSSPPKTTRTTRSRAAKK